MDFALNECLIYIKCIFLKKKEKEEDYYHIFKKWLKEETRQISSLKS